MVDLLFELLTYLWPWRGHREDRSIVGKSRLDEEAARYWKWVVIAILAICAGIWIVRKL